MKPNMNIQKDSINRRDFIRRSILAAAGGALAVGAPPDLKAEEKRLPSPSGDSGGCPQGKIGKLEVSRLILGSNLITFYVHSRDLRFVNNLARHYNTEAKILETLAIAESHGVNTIMTQADEQYLSLLKRYRDKLGGKLQWIVGIMPDPAKPADDRESFRKLADDGVEAMYIHGAPCDKICARGEKDVVARTLDAIKENDIPAGVGAHDLNVVKFCESNKIEADFYVKTFHHHHYPTAPKPEQLKSPLSEIPGYWCKDPVETAEVMKGIAKPWIAFKVMAAGAIPPASAFKYAYENGADFVLAGMFDFEIEEDVKLAREALAAASQRQRPWRA